MSSNSGKAIKATMKAMPMLLRGSKYNKELYLDIMALLYVLLSKARREGILFLEKEIADPAASSVFSQYPRILADAVMMEFLTDYLRLMVGGNMNAFEIENADGPRNRNPPPRGPKIPAQRCIAQAGRRPAGLRYRGGGDGRGAHHGLGGPARRPSWAP